MALFISPIKLTELISSIYQYCDIYYLVFLFMHVYSCLYD